MAAIRIENIFEILLFLKHCTEIFFTQNYLCCVPLEAKFNVD